MNDEQNQPAAEPAAPEAPAGAENPSEESPAAPASEDPASPAPDAAPADAPAADAPAPDAPTAPDAPELNPDESRTDFRPDLRPGDSCVCPDGRPGTVVQFAGNPPVCFPIQDQGVRE